MSNPGNPISEAWRAASDEQRREFVMEYELGLPSRMFSTLFPDRVMSISDDEYPTRTN
jgi:hypothetical protein